MADLSQAAGASQGRHADPSEAVLPDPTERLPYHRVEAPKQANSTAASKTVEKPADPVVDAQTNKKVVRKVARHQRPARQVRETRNFWDFTSTRSNSGFRSWF
jgi:hypothetical protein